MQNLFHNFWTLRPVSTNFGSLNKFLLFKIIEKMIKSLAQYRARNWLWVIAHGGWRPVLQGRPISWLGRRPGGPVQPRLQPMRARRTRPRHGHRTRGGSANGPTVASRWRGSPQEHHRGSGVTPGKLGEVARTRERGGRRRVPGRRRSPAGKVLQWSWSSAMRSCSSGGSRG
jgi:hypothetical protein